MQIESILSDKREKSVKTGSNKQKEDFIPKQTEMTIMCQLRAPKLIEL